MFTVAVIALCDSIKTEQLYNEIKDFIPSELVDDYPYKKGDVTHIPLQRDSAQYNFVWKKANEYGITIYHFYELAKYTTSEIKNAEYFEMGISCALESEGTSAASYGTIYTNCCPECNIGGIPIGDVFVDRKFVKKYQIASVKPDIFVSKQVKWLIESNNLTGVRFETMLKDFKGRELPEYYCMRIDNILPPADKRTWFSFDPPARECKKCGIKVPYLHSDFYYKRSDLEELNDFNLTYEFINNFSERAIIVSKKVKEIFKINKVRVGFNMIGVV